MPRRLARGLRAVGLALLGALALLLVAIQASNWLNWWHARALLRDVKAMPAEPMWPDVQRLMTRWGSWGHYEGTCTSEHCQYTIQVADPILGHLFDLNEWWWGAVVSHAVKQTEHWLGYREAAIYFRMRVCHGRVIFNDVGAAVSIATTRGEEGVIVSSAMRYRLSYNSTQELSGSDEVDEAPNDDDLAEHPDVAVGREICSGCTLDQVALTPFAEAEVRKRYRQFDVSCFAAWGHACRQPSDLLPALRDFDARSDREWARRSALFQATGQDSEGTDTPCRVSPFVLGRDSNYVLAVDPESVEQNPGDANPERIQWTRVRVRDVLKRPAESKRGFIEPRVGEEMQIASEVLPFGARLLLPTDGEMIEVERAFQLSACGPILDTPAAREQVRQGVAQDVPGLSIQPDGSR